MGFIHSMVSQTHGIQRTAPMRWQSYTGFCAVHWEARGESGARGYYLSPDPRLMLFFNDVSHRIVLSEKEAEIRSRWRPMLRALYVPAGVPMWTEFRAGHVFSHLDLHLRRDWLLDRLSPMLGRSASEDALRQPVEVQDVDALAVVATTLAQEINHATRGPQFAESLAVALVAGLIDSPSGPPQEPRAQGGLTPIQMRRLRQLMTERKGRLTNAELSRAVGLSEGWFCHAFKKSTGKTPLQWQQELRISMVKESLLSTDLTLAEIALRYGFSDQGHLTRVFRRYESTTPSTWRREARAR